MHTFRTIAVALFLATVLAARPAFAIPIVPDDFEDGTTEGWVANILGMGAHPAPPANVADGGPLGIGDNYLLLTALGGGGNASRLTAINLSDWAGDYIAAGVTAISMSANNMSGVDLFLRLVFEDPIPGPPMNIAYSSDPILLPAGSGWTPIVFPVAPGFLTAPPGFGDVDTALHNTTLIRLYHSEDDNFPNPVFPIDTVVAQLGVDNIAATTIPEPATLTLLATGIGTIAAKRRRRMRGSVNQR
jgi:hypothetical protein